MALVGKSKHSDLLQKVTNGGSKFREIKYADLGMPNIWQGEPLVHGYHKGDISPIRHEGVPGIDDNSVLTGPLTPLKSDVTAPVLARLDDVERISKLLLTSQGIKWEAHQAELESIQSYITEKRGKYAEGAQDRNFWQNLGRGLLKTLGNTAVVLGQTAVAGTGEHLSSWLMAKRAYLKDQNPGSSAIHGEKVVASPDNLLYHQLPYNEDQVSELVSQRIIHETIGKNTVGTNPTEVESLTNRFDPWLAEDDTYENYLKESEKQAGDLVASDLRRPEEELKEARKPKFRGTEIEPSEHAGSTNDVIAGQQAESWYGEERTYRKTLESRFESQSQGNVYFGPDSKEYEVDNDVLDYVRKPEIRDVKIETVENWEEPYLGDRTVETGLSAKTAYTGSSQIPQDETSLQNARKTYNPYPSENEESQNNKRYNVPIKDRIIYDNGSSGINTYSSDFTRIDDFHSKVDSRKDAQLVDPDVKLRASDSNLIERVAKMTWDERNELANRSKSTLGLHPVGTWYENGALTLKAGRAEGAEKGASIGSYGDSEQSNIDVHAGSKTRVDNGRVDLIPFWIRAITPQGDPLANDGYLFFEANLDSYSDNYSGKWDSTQYVGRADSFYTYTGFERQISFAFKMVAHSKAHLKPIYNRLNGLLSMTAPSYGQGMFMRGTLAEITIGDLLFQQKGFITKVDLNWETDYMWETDRETIMVPHALNVSVGFTPIHSFVPQTRRRYFQLVGDAVDGEPTFIVNREKLYQRR